MKATDAAQYLQLVRKERKTVQSAYNRAAVGSKSQYETEDCAHAPAYLSHLLKIHQQQDRHAQLLTSNPWAKTCCELVRLQNRQVRALGILNSSDAPASTPVSAELLATQLPSPKSLPPGDSPASLRVFQLLNVLADEGSVPFLPNDGQGKSKGIRMTFRNWTSWLLAAMVSIDPLCLHEAECAATVSRLSQHMMSAIEGTTEETRTSSRKNPLLDDDLTMMSEKDALSDTWTQGINTCFLSKWEANFLCCLDCALVDLAKAA